MDEELLTKARAYFGGDRYAVGSGFVIDAVEGDSATCHFDITDSHLNAAGTVMGGAMFALADYTFAVGCNAAFLRGTGARTVAADCHIQFLKAPSRGRLTAHAVPLRNGRKLCYYRVDVTDGDGVLVAAMNCTGCRT
ncbi:MAG: PaaI family thioesterase [Clostridia bacterium]|nr:PaaI family thioesterase [Clostridia bacterium]